MSHLVKKIPSSEFKHFVKSYKFCRFSSNSCSLEGRYGFVSFDFSSFPNIKSCQIRLKKVSGNGLVAVVSGSEAKNYSIVSKVFENINIDLSDSKKVDIFRPSSGIGYVDILYVSLLSENDIDEDSSTNIKHELNKCVKKSIRTVGNRVFANEGSRITFNNSIYLETEPPGMFKTVDKTVQFLGLCEIIKLDVDTSLSPESPKFLTQVRNASNITPNQEGYKSGFENTLKKFIVFDNKPSSSYPPAHNHDVTLFPHGTSMGRYGSISFSTKLEKDVKYVAVISGKNLNGNGQISVLISNSDIKNKAYYLGGGDSLNIPFIANDTDVNISISRNNSATGDVLISRLFISKNKDISERLSNNKNNKDNKNNVDGESVASNITYRGEGIVKKDVWKLSIPKVAHFYWGGKVSFLRYVSICSFIKNNPDWKVKLHVPEIVGDIVPKWKTGEQNGSIDVQKNINDYTSYLYGLNLEIVKHNFDEYNFSNNEHEVHKSDLLRWILLSSEGGLWSDSDIIYTHPIFFMNDNVEEYKSFDTGICKLNQTHGSKTRAHAIGFLMSGGENDFYKSVLDISKKQFNSSQYQCIGSHILNKKMNKINKESKNSKVFEINPNTVYSIGDDNISKFLSKDTYIQDYENAIGFHWYGGSKDISQMESTITHENYHTYDNFLGKLVYYTMNS